MLMKKYKTIYLDPPWPQYGGEKICRGANNHYELMSLREIKEIPIQKLANISSHLYLWSTNGNLPDAFELIKYWGFKYITIITWVKDRIGIGQYFRGQTEHCLFARKGKPLPYKYKEGKRQQGRTVIIVPKTKHSEKPEEMRKLIERVSYPPYIELFARKKTENWDVWGNEVENDIELI